MPETRQAITHRFDVGGHVGYITVGLFEDGTPGELFIVMAKEGSTMSGWADAFSTVFSYALQYGVPLADLIEKLAYSSFEPSGFTKNPDVRFAKSVVDYVVRWMSARFLKKESDGDHSAHVVIPAVPAGGDDQREGTDGQDVSGEQTPAPVEPKDTIDLKLEEIERQKAAMDFLNKAREQQQKYRLRDHGTGYCTKCGKQLKSDETNTCWNCSVVLVRERALERAALDQQPARTFVNSTDAPLCVNCGSVTVRSGSCYLCHTCGATSGCS